MILIYVPCKDENEAKEIGKKLVGERVVACVNVVPKMDSFYFWQGEQQEGSEALMLCKTKKGNKTKVVARIKKLHSYKLPFIGVIKFDEVNKEYMNWMKRVVR